MMQTPALPGQPGLQAQATTPQKSRGPLRRLLGSEVAAAEAVFNAGMELIVPQEQTQRQAFASLLPYLYVLRNKGCSWQQLTHLLTECGFMLKASTVRAYYSEMLATRQGICQEQMNKHMLLLAEGRKKTQGAETPSLTEKVLAMMKRQKATAESNAESKLEALFASPCSSPGPGPAMYTGPGETATPPHVENNKTAFRPTPENQSAAPVALHARMASGPLNQAAPLSKNPAFLASDHACVAPDLTKKAHARGAAPSWPTVNADTPAPPLLRCQPMAEGIKPLARRDGVPAAVYVPGKMAHPAVPNLMLTLEQRLSSADLEFLNLQTGEVRVETLHEKRFRVLWTVPIPMSPSRTGHQFTKMDMSLFR